MKPVLDRILNLFTVGTALALAVLGFAPVDVQAAAADFTCSKIFYNTDQLGTDATNPSSERQDFYYRYTWQNNGVSSTTSSNVLGAGVAANGCGGHIIDLNSSLYATFAAKGGTSGGAAGVGFTLTGSRDLSATAAFPTTVSFTALSSAAVSNTYVTGTLVAVNQLQLVVSNSAAGNSNSIVLTLDEFPNSQTK